MIKKTAILLLVLLVFSSPVFSLLFLGEADEGTDRTKKTSIPQTKPLELPNNKNKVEVIEKQAVSLEAGNPNSVSEKRGIMDPSRIIDILAVLVLAGFSIFIIMRYLFRKKE
ncbi:MAG: hypothetical protein ABIA63_01135 [bacterium]